MFTFVAVYHLSHFSHKVLSIQKLWHFLSARQGRLPTLWAGPQFHDLGVNLWDCLCDVLEVVSAQSLDFIYLVKNCRFLNRTRTNALF